MPIVNKPVMNNKAMHIDTFVYSDGVYDYCIVNGESLTKYFGKEPGEYESYPIHKFADPLSAISGDNQLWVKTLLKYDYVDENPKYKKHKELMETVSIAIECELFGQPLDED